jgi:hypothetical protein
MNPMKKYQRITVVFLLLIGMALVRRAQSLRGASATGW